MGSESNKQLLTVIVPVSRMYGKMQNLFLWLDKIKDQECEVIIVHDRQDNVTSQELQGQLQKLNSPKVRFLEGTFGSPGLARNFAKQFASGTHTMFCDSDDVLELTTILQIIARHPSPSVIIGSYLAVNTLSTQQKDRHKSPENLLQLAKSPGMWRFIFKSDVIQGINFNDYRMGEDQLFLAHVGIFTHEVLRVNETLYHYFTNNIGQLTSQKENIPDLIGVIQDLKDLGTVLRGQNKVFVKLLVLKNCLTIFKSLRTLNGDSRTSVIAYLLRQSFGTFMTLNWMRVLRFQEEMNDES